MENVTRATLVTLLILGFLGSIFVSLTNPEAYLFGRKIGGQMATVYLLVVGVSGTVFAYFIYKRRDAGEIPSLLHFGCLFIKGLATNLISDFGLLFSPSFLIGLASSIILLIIGKMKY